MKSTFNIHRKSIWLISLLFSLTTSVLAQTIVEVMIDQPEKLEIIANEIFYQTVNTTILGDQVSITGGTYPYQYSWINGGQEIGTTLIVEVPKFTPTNSLTLTVIDANNCSCTRNAILTSIDDENIDQSSIMIYPNPSTNFIVIDPQEINNVFEVLIFDNRGLCLLNKQINGKTTINIDLPSGIYFLRIEDKKMHAVILRKLIIL